MTETVHLPCQIVILDFNTVPPAELVLQTHSLRRILSNHEGLVATVHLSFQHRLLSPNYLMDEASAHGERSVLTSLPKGFRTMHTNHKHQIFSRCKTTGMALGLVRLLQDAGRSEEARTTLASLKKILQGVADHNPDRDKTTKRIL